VFVAVAEGAISGASVGDGDGTAVGGGEVAVAVGVNVAVGAGVSVGGVVGTDVGGAVETGGNVAVAATVGGVVASRVAAAGPARVGSGWVVDGGAVGGTGVRVGGTVAGGAVGAVVACRVVAPPTPRDSAVSSAGPTSVGGATRATAAVAVSDLGPPTATAGVWVERRFSATCCSGSSGNRPAPSDAAAANSESNPSSRNAQPRRPRRLTGPPRAWR
jgi:hypothetical protein